MNFNDRLSHKPRTRPLSSGGLRLDANALTMHPFAESCESACPAHYGTIPFDSHNDSTHPEKRDASAISEMIGSPLVIKE